MRALGRGDLAHGGKALRDRCRAGGGEVAGYVERGGGVGRGVGLELGGGLRSFGRGGSRSGGHGRLGLYGSRRLGPCGRRGFVRALALERGYGPRGLLGRLLLGRLGLLGRLRLGLGRLRRRGSRGILAPRGLLCQRRLRRLGLSGHSRGLLRNPRLLVSHEIPSSRVILHIVSHGRGIMCAAM